MRNFIRYSKKRIVDTESRRPISERMLYLRYKQGQVTTYIDSTTKENLIPKLIEKYTKEKYAARYSKTDNELEELGSANPLNETKYYNCSTCDNPTPNRFRCSGCWEKISHISAGTLDEDDYFMGDYSSHSDSYD